MNSPNFLPTSTNGNYQYQRPFPVDVLPKTIQSALAEVNSYTQAPQALIASELLATISLACQGSFNVRRPNGPAIPCSIWTLTIAESGERKSAVSSIVAKPIEELQNECAKKAEDALLTYEIEYLAWQVEQKAILDGIAKKIKKDESSDALKLKLKEHKLTEPKKPICVKFLYENTSPEALQQGLFENGKFAGIFSDEAGSVFDGQAMRNFSMMNTLWGGGTLTVDRRSSPSFVLQDARLTMSLMVQPSVIQKFYDKRGEEARGIGLLARFLISQPPSTQGFRYISNNVTSWDYLNVFHDRIRALLKQSISDDGGHYLVGQVLELSPDAANYWTNKYNAIEARILFGGELFNVKDYASKIAENILRISALLHVIEGYDGPISEDTVSRACVISKWYGDEFVRLFSPAPQMPQAQIDSFLLAAWLKNLIVRGQQIIKKNHILQFCPNQLRSKARLNEALEWLIRENKIVAYLGDKHGVGTYGGNTVWIDFRNIYAVNFNRKDF